MRISIFALLMQILVTVPAHATNIELELSQGSETKSQELSADGQFGSSDSKKKKREKEENSYLWDLSYTHSTIQVKQQTGGVITDNSHSVTVGAGLETPSRFSFNTDLNYSKTPEENLQSYGPSMVFGYTYEFGKKKTFKKKNSQKDDNDNDDEEDFKPSVGAELTIGYDNYVQTFGKTARRKANGVARPVTGSNEINKKSGELSLKVHPWSWVSARASYTKYSYNKDVNEFLQYLDVHAIGHVSAGMEDALAGFYSDTKTVSLSFYILEDWELDLEHSASTVISDQSESSYDKGTVYVDLGETWRLGAGFEYSKSNGSTAVEPTDKTFLLSLACMF